MKEWVHSSFHLTDLNNQSVDKENIRRVSSTGSLNHVAHAEQDRCKDSNDSSTEETDALICVSETTSFTMGGR